MRITGNAIIAFILIFIMSMGLPCGMASGAADPQSIPGNFQKVAENGVFVLYVDEESGEFAVSDMQTGSMWWSNPPDREKDTIAKGMQKMDLNSQLILKYADTDARNESLINTYTGSVKKGGAHYSAIKNGFRIEYSIQQKKSKVTLEVTLKDGYIEVNVPVDKIVENSPEVVYSISVLPFFGAAGPQQDNGYMLVPDGTGALINYNNKKQIYDEYSKSFYGKDYACNSFSRGSVDQEARIPVFGTQNGSCGYIAAVTDGDAFGTVKARVSGMKSSYNTVFCDFALRTTDISDLGNDHRILYYDKRKTQIKNITIRYYFLTGRQCDYNAMASKYREYLVNEKGFSEKTGQADMPLYIELYGAILKKKNFLGIPVVVTQPLTDYKSALELMKNARIRGINNIVFKYTNANRNNINGTYLTRFRLEQKLGNSKQLKELVNYCNDNNIVFAPNADLIYFKKGSFGLSAFTNAVRTLSGPFAFQYNYWLGADVVNNSKDASYLMSPSKLPGKVRDLNSSIRKLGLNSISLDTLGKNLYSDFYMSRSNRQESLMYMEKTIKSIAEKTNNILLSNANIFMLQYAEYVEDLPQTSSKFDITDEDIPFLQLVLSGLISYSTPAVNLVSDPEKAVLTAVENGSSLKYTWITGDTSNLINTDYMDLYGTDYKTWFDSALANYKKLNEVYRKTEGTRIISHRILSQGVRETTYENGVRIIVNYNDFAYTENGRYKVESKSFIIKQEG